MGVSIIKSDGTESTFPRCTIALDGRDLLVRSLEGDVLANFGLKWRSATDDTKRLTNAAPAPSWIEHRAAALRGLLLCMDCGAELLGLVTPEFDQFCGDCEHARGEEER